MRIPSSKGFSPAAPSPVRESAKVNHFSGKYPSDSEEQASRSVEVRLSTEASSFTTYLRLIKELPETRKDVVARVKTQLREGVSVATDEVADALLLDGRHVRPL